MLIRAMTQFQQALEPSSHRRAVWRGVRLLLWVHLSSLLQLKGEREPSCHSESDLCWQLWGAHGRATTCPLPSPLSIGCEMPEERTWPPWKVWSSGGGCPFSTEASCQVPPSEPTCWGANVWLEWPTAPLSPDSGQDLALQKGPRGAGARVARAKRLLDLWPKVD